MAVCLEYETSDGRRPFGEWFEKIDALAAVKVVSALERMKAGNLGDVKSVGEGVSERRIHFGPGLRLYFGKDGEDIIILLVGGTKKRQQKDIEDAKEFWADFKKRKRKQKKE